MRLFTAVELSPALRQAVHDAAARFLALPPGARWTRAVRAVPPDNLHVTVRFLGDVDAEQVDAVVAALRRAADMVAPGGAHLTGFGAFPTPRRPRVVWCGVRDPDGALTSLEAVTTAALLPLGFPPESRPFAPHVTVARVGDARATRAIAQRFEHAASGDLLDTRSPAGAFPVRRMTLFRSSAGAARSASHGRPARSHGPRYEALARIDLTGAA